MYKRKAIAPLVASGFVPRFSDNLIRTTRMHTIFALGTNILSCTSYATVNSVHSTCMNRH